MQCDIKHKLFTNLPWYINNRGKALKLLYS